MFCYSEPKDFGLMEVSSRQHDDRMDWHDIHI